MACENSLGSIWPDDLYFVVPAADGEYISDGGQIILLPSIFNGWKLRINRNNVPIDYLDQGTGDPYWNQSGNTVILSQDVNTNEKFLIMAYKPSV